MASDMIESFKLSVCAGSEYPCIECSRTAIHPSFNVKLMHRRYLLHEKKKKKNQQTTSYNHFFPPVAHAGTRKIHVLLFSPSLSPRIDVGVLALVNQHSEVYVEALKKKN